MSGYGIAGRYGWIAFWCACASLAGAQVSGTYTGGGAPVSWSISRENALVWGGIPYVPVGIQIQPTEEQVRNAAAAGVTDVLVDLPRARAQWQPIADALNAANMRYLIRIDSLAPAATGAIVEPQAYRIPAIRAKRTVEVSIPGVRSALVVLAQQRDGTVVDVKRVAAADGKIRYDAVPRADIDHLVLIYPMGESAGIPDLWERFDDLRDELLATAKSTRFGGGLRGFVNPVGRALNLPGRQLSFVPTNPAFRAEMAKHLEERYRTLETAMRGWAMASSELSMTDQNQRPMASWQILARMIPLWHGQRGIGQLWDPETDKLYTVDSRRSGIWADITEVVNRAGVNRFQRLVRSLQSVANVPVVQEWAGWSSAYENPSTELTGLGMRVIGPAPSLLIEDASRPVSSVLRWNRPGWLLATAVDLRPANPDSVSQLPGVLDDLSSLGARGFFLRVSPQDFRRVVLPDLERRGGAAAFVVANPEPLFFPENARNPAQPMRIAGGRWWLPAPNDGNRIDLGDSFWAYQIVVRGETQYVIWARSPGRYRFRVLPSPNARYVSSDGTNTDPRQIRNGVEITFSTAPIVISGVPEIPIPEIAFLETTEAFDKLIEQARAQRRDAVEERSEFARSVVDFATSPGGTFSMLRALYHRTSQRLGEFTWIEAEVVRDHNFSEALADPACSNEMSLSLRTPIASADSYFMDASVNVRSAAEQTVWVAARIPEDMRSSVRMRIGGQTLSLTEPPVGLYGNGFGWYRMGVTRFAGEFSRVRLEVGVPSGADLAIDAILITPSQFAPSGVRPPSALRS
jgi:hypothetical protein